MIIEFPFDLGQEVWPIQNRHEQVWTPCAACEGVGSVELKNGRRVCPECYGRMGRFEYKPTRWMLAEGRGRQGELRYLAPLTIGQVSVEITDKTQDFKVMLEETGVGSGTWWYAKNIYATEAEAIAECEMRNACVNEGVTV